MTNVAAERDAFEAWYAKRHPKPTHENSTRAHCAKMDDWEVWQARAGAAPAAVAPQAVVAWMTPEGDRVVTAETMDGARKDGGASLSSLRPYTVALVRGAAAPALEAPAAPPPRTTGYIAPKGRYVPPVLFDPYTGEPRDARDIASDPQGVLIVPPGAAIQQVREG